MRKIDLLSASAVALLAMLPSTAFGQTTSADPAPAQPAPAQQAPGSTGFSPAAQEAGWGSDIVVTAQRQAQTLQDVPIAVSAFSAETLQAQQIDNASDLQLTLPNVTFSKGNFRKEGSAITILTSNGFAALICLSDGVCV